MEERYSDEVVKMIFEQSYENRTNAEHKIAIQVITSAIPSLTDDQAKIMSNFAKIVSGSDEQFHQTVKHLSLFIQRNSKGHFDVTKIASKQELANIDLNLLTIYISAQNALKTEIIKSIEEEVRFFQKCALFQDIPRKRFYHILRNTQILSYSFGQSVYCQGDEIPPAGAFVYLIRQGQFCFKRISNDHHRIHLFDFGVGYLFGTEDDDSSNPQRKRKFTVSCKSSRGIVFKFGEQFFNYFLRKSCDHQLKVNQQKRNNFINERTKKIQENRGINSQFLTQVTTLKRSFSLQGGLLSAPKLFKSRIQANQINGPKSPDKKQAQRLPYLKLKDVSSMNRLVSKGQLAKIMNPEYKQEIQILNRKYKCEKIREIAKIGGAPTRGQVLMGLMKNSWQFQKNRKKPTKL